jgi:ATP-dependent metalloprotease FtsH
MKQLKSINNIEEIVMKENVAIAKINSSVYYRVIVPNSEYIEKQNLDENIPIYYNNDTNSNLSYYILYAIIIYYMLSLFRKQGMSILDMNKTFKIDHIDIRFSDVIGQNNAKRNVGEFIDILKNRKKYNAIGVKVPKGILLSGPPGTGKTLLAKAVAGESKLPFINVCGSDFTAMFVGVGSSRVRQLYEYAREVCERYNGCIIFIDEIDTLGVKRDMKSINNSERENTLNQFLNELDGFDNLSNVLTIGATNRPDHLDEALLRPGRIDRKITMSIPTIKERKELFHFYLKRLNIEEDNVDDICDECVKLTPQFTGADVDNVVNEAGIIAVRNNKTNVDISNIKDAIDYVMMGDLKDDILLEQEKQVVAYHEGGHAFLSCILENVENPVKVSIIPREKGMLGFSQSEASENNLVSKEKMEEEIMVLMGGRIAEEVFCNDITTGASNDIERASKIADHYIKIYGFGKEKFFNTYDDNVYKNDISNFIKDGTSKEIIALLKSLYNKTKQVIKDNSNSIHAIQGMLLKKDTLYYDDLITIIKKKI